MGKVEISGKSNFGVTVYMAQQIAFQIFQEGNVAAKGSVNSAYKRNVLSIVILHQRISADSCSSSCRHNMLLFRAMTTPPPPPRVSLSFHTITYLVSISSSFSMPDCYHVSVSTIMSGSWRIIICSKSSVLFTRLLTFTFNILSSLHIWFLAEFSLCGTGVTCWSSSLTSSAEVSYT